MEKFTKTTSHRRGLHQADAATAPSYRIRLASKLEWWRPCWHVHAESNEMDSIAGYADWYSVARSGPCACRPQPGIQVREMDEIRVRRS